jgi:hypothetical protein
VSFRFIAIAALAIHSANVAQSGEKTDLAALIAEAESRRDANVREVRSVREYVVRNPRWRTEARMQAIMITSADGNKRYEITSMNADGIRKSILMKILEGEVQAAAKKDRDGNVNAVNYELRPSSAPSDSGQRCRIVELIPRKRTRFTFDGRGCVDMADMAMVRMEGRTAKRISFLVGRADVVQEFRKIGNFWYSSASHSTADVKFFGQTELTINYVAYTITAKTGETITASLPREPHSRP